MSFPLIFLFLFCLILSVVGIVDTRRLLHYPVAAGLLMLAFILPQAYAVERLRLADLLDPPYSWVYFFVCMVMVVIGWIVGRRFAARNVPSQTEVPDDESRYSVPRLVAVCLGMGAVGAYSFYQMTILARVGDYGSEWTGVITLYYLLSGLLVMTLSLSWLAYLRTGRRVFLVMAIISFLIFLPTLTVSVKRSWIFEVAIILIGGLVFVRRYKPNRIAVIAAIVFGTVLLHQVGQVRGYVDQNDATAIEAIAQGELTRNFAIVEMEKAPEVQGAVTRIAVSRLEGQYEPGLSIWNRLVHQYVPAFIVGSENKQALQFESNLEEKAQHEYFWYGATHTGFADSFSSFWWWGSLCFFLISFLFARFWELAINGDLRAQFLYLALLNDGLVAITESISRFVASLPFIFAVTLAVFWFAKAVRPQPQDQAPSRTIGARLGGA